MIEGGGGGECIYIVPTNSNMSVSLWFDGKVPLPWQEARSGPVAGHVHILKSCWPASAMTYDQHSRTPPSQINWLITVQRRGDTQRPAA